MWQNLHYNGMVTIGMINSRNHIEGFPGISAFFLFQLSKTLKRGLCQYQTENYHCSY